jgi:cytochrome c oxidase subunit 3
MVVAEAGQEPGMTNAPAGEFPPNVRRGPDIVAVDDRRGAAGMLLFIATEGFLFIMLFFAYFYLAQGGWRWLAETPPKLHLAIPMLIILLISSAVLYWGEQRIKKLEYAPGRAALGVTILLGVIFLVLSAFDYMEHLRELTPQMNTYGSIFYTIVSFHAAHLLLGLLMLAYVMILPRLEPAPAPPHRPYHAAALYWHFVDFVWIWIVAFLYVAPNIR